MPKTIRPVNGQAEVTPEMARIAADVESHLAAQLMAEEIAKLKAENESLRTRPVTGLTLKISEKGALSVYGMGRFPFTLYVEQWERLLAMADQIKAFIQANGSRLSRKS